MPTEQSLVGAYVDASGVTQKDNLLKPDLLAPGNKIVGALASDKAGAGGSWAKLPSTYAVLSSPYGASSQQANLKQLLNLSGTSIAAPAVAGTVALMLQANPGLTSPLVTAGVVNATPLAGTSPNIGKTGTCIPTATLSGWLMSGSGTLLTNGIILSEGLILGEGITFSESGQPGGTQCDASLLREP